MQAHDAARVVQSTQPSQTPILLAQRASAERYPPLLHQAALLQAVGRVRILDAPSHTEEEETLTEAGVARIRVRASLLHGNRNSIANLGWAFRYVREFRRQQALRPIVTIAYEPDAAALVLCEGSKSARMMRIVHLHEIPDKSLYAASSVSRLSVRYMLANLTRADLVIVPDAERARFAMKKASLDTLPTVVMNCPPVVAHLPESKLLPWLAQRGVATRRIVHFQGSLGADRGLARVVASMRYWPADAVFVIVGEGAPAFRQELAKTASQMGMGSRVFFVGRVSYSDVFHFAIGASVGVTLVEPFNTNLRFCAGASNKRFEYAALGIPQVTNGGPGMRELFESPGIASLVNSQDVEMLGNSIARLLNEPSFAASMSNRARRMHIDQYNYESQFAPVVSRIQDWIATHREVPR